MVKALSDYVFQVENLRDGTRQCIHGSCLKFYSDRYLNFKAIFTHILSFKTEMPVARLLYLERTKSRLLVVVS